MRLPISKPLLAHALAVEWDQLVSAAQATKQHLIPLTSLVCRALDISSEEGGTPSSPSTTTTSSSSTTIRNSVISTLLRFLDTDSLLCWNPPPSDPDPSTHNDETSLRTLQETTAARITSYLTTHVWPGVTFHPALDDQNSILPRPQTPDTHRVIQGWMLSLTPFELAGLERATLAGKSLLAAARLVAEWSEDHHHRRLPLPTLEQQQQQQQQQQTEKFGVEEAARAVSLEVDWQTGRWGEVEDTHDVEKEDLRRQLGSAVLLVCGTGR
jgi:ATP synthase F1 complex assembly factor 2